jgi:hypothetical protein
LDTPDLQPWGKAMNRQLLAEKLMALNHTEQIFRKEAAEDSLLLPLWAYNGLLDRACNKLLGIDVLWRNPHFVQPPACSLNHRWRST